MPINTLKVATQGYLPSQTSLSLATLGWLGIIPLAIFFTDQTWILAKQDTSWNLQLQNTNWTLHAERIKWKLNPERIKWSLSFTKYIWILPEEI